MELYAFSKTMKIYARNKQGLNATFFIQSTSINKLYSLTIHAPFPIQVTNDIKRMQVDGELCDYSISGWPLKINCFSQLLITPHGGTLADQFDLCIYNNELR